ncbi:unnamed protein product [Darwinula stevensoni]|uniref:Rab-GAP TBC domain-containing protein n=1 Tax=Darwinula stevensoni TaxID=69355 RepID=A0A7R9A3Z0_9CRUS|nr:unnamed protein product [Darwinula stevensoni]CAG0892581.1 unnamed protein product [Darwinula stevensoni]
MRPSAGMDAFETRKEWESLFGSRETLNTLREKAQKGGLKESRFRGIAWRIFLGVLDGTTSRRWREDAAVGRLAFEELRERCRSHPAQGRLDDLDPHIENPLSQDDHVKIPFPSLLFFFVRPSHLRNASSFRPSLQSLWNQYFKDGSLRSTIEQDAVRTFPEEPFFRDPKIQSILVDVLFYYARKFPHVAYRQGMHEILAPIIYVLDSDSRAFRTVRTSTRIDDPVMEELLDPVFVEHDSFCLFAALMEMVGDWYVTREELPLENRETKEGRDFGCNGGKSEVVRRVNRIFRTILKSQDLDLFLHLQNLDIPPQLFGIRWLRLLFGREFPYRDLLCVWDAIFATGTSLSLVDHLFASLLIAVRQRPKRKPNRSSRDRGSPISAVSDGSSSKVCFSYPFRFSRLFLASRLGTSDSSFQVPIQGKGKRGESAVGADEGGEKAHPRRIVVRELKPLKERTGRKEREDESGGGVEEGTEAEEIRDLVRSCCLKMSVHITRLQETLQHQPHPLDHEDLIFVSLAQIKQVRDAILDAVGHPEDVAQPLSPE